MNSYANGKSHQCSGEPNTETYKGITEICEQSQKTTRILHVKTIAADTQAEDECKQQQQPEIYEKSPPTPQTNQGTKTFQPPRVITALRTVAIEMLQVANELESQDRQSARVFSHLQTVENELEVVARELHKVVEGLQLMSRSNSLFASGDVSEQQDQKQQQQQQPDTESILPPKVEREPMQFCDIFVKPETANVLATEFTELKLRSHRIIESEPTPLHGASSKEGLLGEDAYKKFQNQGSSADEYADDEDEDDDDEEEEDDEGSDKSVGEECDWSDEDDGDDPYTEDVDFTDTLEEDSEKEAAFFGYDGEEGDECSC